MDLSARTGRTLGTRDVASATVLCAGMCAAFWVLGSGASLRVTFVPGALVTLALVVVLRRTGAPLPSSGRVLRLYAAALAWQLVHLAEELATGFWRDFPVLYGGAPYPVRTFVWFNALAYAAFGAATVAVVVHGRGTLLLPSLFFVVYGTLGNAVAHLVWAVLAGGYFPGLVTACGYLVIGPALLGRMWVGARWWYVGAVVAVLATVLVPCLVLPVVG